MIDTTTNNHRTLLVFLMRPYARTVLRCIRGMFIFTNLIGFVNDVAGIWLLLQRMGMHFEESSKQF